MEFDNVRDALGALLYINNRHINKSNVSIEKDESGTHKRNATYNDLQDFNWNTVANICDLLGMEDIYLEGNTIIKKKED